MEPGPSSRIVASEIVESPESPQSPNNVVENIPYVGVEISLGIGLESSSEDEYEETSSEEDNKNGPVNIEQSAEQNEPVDYGYDEVYIGDTNFTLYTRRDVYLLKGWRAFVLERRNCAGFLTPEPPIPERLN